MYVYINNLAVSLVQKNGSLLLEMNLSLEKIKHWVNILNNWGVYRYSHLHAP